MLVKGVHNMKETSYLTAVNMTFISWSFKHDKLLNYTQKNQETTSHHSRRRMTTIPMAENGP